MAFEIKIYGDISDQRGENLFTLEDLQDQLKNYNGEESVLVRLKTNGGLVDEGFAIYNELRRFSKEKNVKIITRADGFVASIGTVIFLAGNKRILSQYIDPFFHKASGNTDKEHLKKINTRIAEFYAEHTELNAKQALQLMANDTYLDPQTAKNIGFGTEIEQIRKPEILMQFSQPVINTKQHNTMNESKNDKSFCKKFIEKVESIIKNEKIYNKIIFDANNEELLFPDLEDDETITIGARATYKGAEANGEIVVADGDTYVFENGILKDIIKKIDEEQGAEKRALEEKIKELQDQLQAMNATKSEVENKLSDVQTELKSKNEVIDKIVKLKSEYLVDDKKDAKKESHKESITAHMDLNSIKI